MLDFLSEEYEILQFLGEGASAKIYKVLHKEFGTIRAIRVLKTSVPDKSDGEYKDFLRECKTLLQLGNGGHPNIVRIYKPTLLQGHALVEMDYVKGCDIQNYLEDQDYFLPIAEVYRFVQEVGSALAYCHVDCYKDRYNKNEIYRYELDSPLKGLTFKIETDPNDGRQDLLTDLQKRELIRLYSVIHNDLHSKNIMRKSDGSYILLDFGLAIEQGQFLRSSIRRGGAVEYKSPEKDGREDKLSTQSDIYSFGILMYQMLAGRVPFPYDRSDYASEEEALCVLRKKHAYEMPPPIEPIRKAAYENRYPAKVYRKDYPTWLEMMIMKCLNKKPEDRYADAHEFMEEFNKYRQGEIAEENDTRVRVISEENKDLKEKLKVKEDENVDLKNTLALMKTTTAASIINSYEDELEALQAKINDLQMKIDMNLKHDAERDMMAQKYVVAKKKMEEYKKLNAYLNKRIQSLEEGKKDHEPSGHGHAKGRFFKQCLPLVMIGLLIVILMMLLKDMEWVKQLWQGIWK